MYRLLQCELQREKVFHACTHAKMHGGILTPYLWSDINVSITWVGFFFEGGRGGAWASLFVSNSGEIRGRKNKTIYNHNHFFLVLRRKSR